MTEEGRRHLVDEPAVYVVDWLKEVEHKADRDLRDLVSDLRRELQRSDKALEKRITQDVETRIQAAEEAVGARLGAAIKAEQEARRLLEQAMEVKAEAERRLKESITLRLKGRMGPMARDRVLEEVLSSRFNRAMRYRDLPPDDAWYLSGVWAFGKGKGDGEDLPDALTLEEADTFADSVRAVVTGYRDESLDALAVLHNCSLYHSVRLARAAGERTGAYIKRWPGPVSMDKAVEFCRFSWAGRAAQGATLEEWLVDLSLTLVRRAERVPFVDGVRTICFAPTAEIRVQMQVLEGGV